MTFKAILSLSRALPYWEATEKQVEAVHAGNYELAHIYNCCTWLQLFKTREGPQKNTSLEIRNDFL